MSIPTPVSNFSTSHNLQAWKSSPDNGCAVIACLSSSYRCHFSPGLRRPQIYSPSSKPHIGRFKEKCVEDGNRWRKGGDRGVYNQCRDHLSVGEQFLTCVLEEAVTVREAVRRHRNRHYHKTYHCHNPRHHILNPPFTFEENHSRQP